MCTTLHLSCRVVSGNVHVGRLSREAKGDHRGRGTWVRMAGLALLWGSAFLWIKVALSNGLTPLQITVEATAVQRQGTASTTG